MIKGIFVILDGVADEPCDVLGERTPLEYARTPNLDIIAKHSRIDHCFTIKEGVVPQSSGAIASLLGNDPNLAFRGYLEAEGAGIKLTKGDLALRCNFATVDNLEGNILERRAGRTLSTKEAKKLSKAVNNEVKLPFKFEFRATHQHRGVLVFKGGFSNNITNVDPAYGAGVANRSFSSRVQFSKSIDEKDDSKLAADLVNSFVRKSYAVLNKHPINLLRVKRGLFAANFILCRDAGNKPVQLRKLPGKWMALAYMPLEIGIAKAAKMGLYIFTYPKMKGIDVYGNLDNGLKKATKHAIKMLKKYSKAYDYFYIHFKETDVPGHDNKPLEKVKMIEMLDSRFFSYLKGFLKESNIKLLLTADHTTSCRKKSHSDKPVPVLFYDYKTAKKEKWHRFIEEEGMKGRKFVGRKLLENTLLRI